MFYISHQSILLEGNRINTRWHSSRK